MVLGNVDHSVLGFGPVGRAARNALGTLPARVRTPMEDNFLVGGGTVYLHVEKNRCVWMCRSEFFLDKRIPPLYCTNKAYTKS